MFGKIGAAFCVSVCALIVSSWTLNWTLAQPARAETIVGLASSFPPLQMNSDIGPRGFATDLSQRMLHRASRTYGLMKYTIQFLPFKRVLLETETRDDAIAFSLSRTPEREDKFHWIGEVAPYEVHFVSHLGRPDLEIQSIHDFRWSQLKIAVQRGSNTASLLQKYNFRPDADFEEYGHFTQGLKMLFMKRIDVMPLTLAYSRNTACNLGLPGNELVPLLHIKELSRPLWLVAGLKMKPDLVALLKETYAGMVADGTVKAVQDRAIAEWGRRPCRKLQPTP